ncbi:MAG: hypothetical protein HRU77_06240 [Gammaproteobacteria bacterium]|nr:MAG: hypothetical protein HRU77_06240 [Gammaproteobacteria bacterium]
MNLGRCPVCHSHIQLEAIIQDEAASRLVGILSGMDAELSRAMVTYLGLFRTPKRDLPNDRALKLCQEVMALTNDHATLAEALAKTVEQIRAKGGDSMKNHNYLKSVVESVEKSANLPTCTKPQTGKGARMSKTEQALMSIESLKDRYD